MNYFTSSDLKDFLIIELQHSLDIYSLHRMPEYEDTKKFDPKNPIYLLKDFYRFLSEIRYSANLSIGSSDFSMDEFTESYSIQGLCDELRQDNLPIMENTVEALNNLLKNNKLYDLVKSKKKDKVSAILIKLKQTYDESKDQDDLKKLNRFVLEEFYPQKTPKKVSIKGENYIQYYKENYKQYIDRADEMISSIFKQEAQKIDKSLLIDGLSKADVLERTVIHNFYDLIKTNLNKFLDKNNKREALEKGTDIISLIAKSVIDLEKTVTFSEKIQIDKDNRYLKNKHQRYSSLDRAAYWIRLVKDYRPKPFYEDIKDEIRHFLIQKDVPINLKSKIVKFLLLLLTKYHFILHEYGHGAYEFRSLNQHIDNAELSKEQIEMAQKVFTFTRLVAKHFPLIFAPDDEQSKAIARTIQILSYIRRGFAYSSLGKTERAFNDFTSAEKEVSLLRNEYIESTENFIVLYRDLTIPYIYSLKGELYRKAHAFYNAHQYFCNAINRLEEKEKEDKIKKLINQSLKIPRIKMTKGKTFLELGEFRKSLKWYLKSLEHLIKIFGSNQTATSNIIKTFNDLFSYLEETRLDPKLIKGKLFETLTEVTEQVEKFINNSYQSKQNLVKDYGILLSDLFNRISFVVFLLNLPELLQKIETYKNATSLDIRKDIREKLCRNILACKWLSLAIKLNQRNSLARFNAMLFELLSTCDKTKMECNRILNITSSSDVDLMEFGNPRDIIYRQISELTLKSLRMSDIEDMEVDVEANDKNIAKNLLQRLLLYEEDFSTKNAELYKYLMKERHESIRNKKKPLKDIYLYMLQRWSSINPALPRPSTFKMKGGGYFITYNGKGIAIDPGINFVENLYSEGFSIADIDYVIATHDHIDHTADIDTILAIHYKRQKFIYKEKAEKKNKIKDKNNCMTLLLNPSVSSRYSFIINQNPDLFKKIELSTETGAIKIFDGFAIEAKKVEHLDISSPEYSNSIGLILKFQDDKNEFRIGITSDTKYLDHIMEQFLDVDILIVHINGASFRELRDICKIDLQDPELQKLLVKIESQKGQKEFKSMLSQIKYSLGYDPNDPISYIFSKSEKLKKLEDDHMCLEGVIKTYKQFAKKPLTSDKERLFIVSEISEEMGSYRHKVAALLNQQFVDFSKKVRCLTADIGMVIRVKQSEEEMKTEICCSRCRLNNDYTDNDKFHAAKNIKEVCLKREDEGIFYYCQRHDPESIDRQIKEYGFVERIERYQPVKHIDIRIP